MKKFIMFAVITLAMSVNAALPMRRSVEKGSDISSKIRERNVPQTLMYAEIQSYLLVENYLHYFSERPLFHDSSLRGKGQYENSFRKEVDTISKYDIDGFAILACDGKIAQYGSHLQTLNKFAPYKGFGYIPGASWPNKPDKEYVAKLLNVFRMAVNSPYTTRVDGKIPVWGYRTSYLPEGKLTELTKYLKEQTGVEPIFFCELDDNTFRVNYMKRGKLTPTELSWLRHITAKTLDNCGGLMIDPTISVRTDGDYTRIPDAGYTRDCIIPIIKELLKKPKYKGKYLGGWVNKGYMNARSGNNTGEYGTSTFRKGMEEMIKLNPDIIVFFEWNEFNENTHFMPTVNNGTTMQRLIRYYSAKLRGNPLTANPDADLSVPNVIFSGRKTLRLGDTLRYEILNIPESENTEKFTVQLRLYDIDRNVIETFAPETFVYNELCAVTYEIPTTVLAQYQLVVPELTVNVNGKTQKFIMHHNRIFANTCYSYKEIMQPLRDILPLNAGFDIAPLGNGKYMVKAQVQAAEPLAQVELLDHDEELYAVDREKLYDPNNNIIIRGSFSTFKPVTHNISFRVHNSENWKYFREHFRNRSEDPDPAKVNGTVNDPRYFVHFYYPYPFFITVPKSEAANAVLEIDIAGIANYKFSVSELIAKEKYAVTLDKNSRLDIDIAQDLVDIPVPLNAESAAFETTVSCKKAFPVYQLRAISKSGRIYRSFPIMPCRAKGKTVSHPVWSAAEKKAVTVQIAADRIPELKYIFDPASGAMMKNSCDPWFDAQLGGGFLYIEPFNRPRNLLLPHPQRGKMDPVWIKENGENLLSFDGKGQYINFPREVMPYGSFTMEFEIRPASDGNDVLFRHKSYHSGFMNLYRRDGKLEAEFTCRKTGLELSDDKKFATGLNIPTGKWSKVTVSYDLTTIKFTVDGKTVSYPFDRQGVFYKPCVFGGHCLGAGKDMRFFHGELKSLRFKHSAE
ncbi:MAG: LamG domain-containing protein [Lentisphaerae bacterium]|nr:LamG domain-containing protein [Lentisphaerota bacterium]